MGHNDVNRSNGTLTKTARRLAKDTNRRVLAAKGEVPVQLADLLVFLGYFGLCLYAGGVAYVEAYNAELRLAILSATPIVATAQIYLQNVFGSIWSGIGLTLGVAVLSYIYVLARFALRLWFGLALVVGSFCGLLLFCFFTGDTHGKAAAESVFVRNSNPLPVIKVGVDDLDDGSYLLLHDSGSHLFILRPTAAQYSTREIRVILKEKLPNFEIILP